MRGAGWMGGAHSGMGAGLGGSMRMMPGQQQASGVMGGSAGLMGQQRLGAQGGMRQQGFPMGGGMGMGMSMGGMQQQGAGMKQGMNNGATGGAAMPGASSGSAMPGGFF